MSYFWTKYQTSDGFILGIGQSSSMPPSETGVDFLIGEQGDQLTQYVSGDPAALTSRPADPTSIDTTTIDADGVDEATISSIPNPTTVIVNGPILAVTDVTDGTFEFSTDTAGTYVITVNMFPNRVAEYTVIAS